MLKPKTSEQRPNAQKANAVESPMQKQKRKDIFSITKLVFESRKKEEN